MAGGRDVLNDVNSQIDSLEREYHAIRNRLDSNSSAQRRFSAERAKAFDQLAEFYLPELTDQAIINIRETLTNKSADVLRILEEKEQHKLTLNQAIDRNLLDRNQLREDLGSLDVLIVDNDVSLDQAGEGISLELANDTNYCGLKDKAIETGQKLAQLEAQHQAFAKNAKERLPAYTQNKLFSYLLNRDFGTESSEGNFLTRRLDVLVARKIRYSQQKSNYDTLQKMPEAMARIIESINQELQHLTASLQVIEGKVEEKYDLPSIQTVAADLASRKKGLVSRLDQNERDYGKMVQEVADLKETTDRYHENAVDGLVTYLKSEPIRELKRRALATPDPRDDHLVERISTLDAELEMLTEKSIPLSSAERKVGLQLDDLRKVENHLRSNNYDSNRSYYSGNFDMNSLLIGYLAGNNSIHSITQRIDDSHRRKSPPSPVRSTYSNSSSSSSSSFGSSGFSSGGGFGGGGFSSGGGF